MLKSMRIVFRTALLTVEVVSRETLTALPNFFADKTGIANFDALLDLDVGPCTSNQALTTEQTQLYQNRNKVNNNFHIVVYFVRRVLENGTDTMFGCAGPSDTLPISIAISEVATRWTLAHEVGHALGLQHVAGEACDPGDVSTNLMTGCGTDTIIGIPTLSQTEQSTMNAHPLVGNF